MTQITWPTGYRIINTSNFQDQFLHGVVPSWRYDFYGSAQEALESIAQQFKDHPRFKLEDYAIAYCSYQGGKYVVELADGPNYIPPPQQFLADQGREAVEEYNHLDSYLQGAMDATLNAGRVLGGSSGGVMYDEVICIDDNDNPATVGIIAAAFMPKCPKAILQIFQQLEQQIDAIPGGGSIVNEQPYRQES